MTSKTVEPSELEKRVTDWALKHATELWSGTIDGRRVRILLFEGHGLGIAVESLGLMALDIRDWWDAAVYFTAMVTDDEAIHAKVDELVQEAKTWTRH